MKKALLVLLVLSTQMASARSILPVLVGLEVRPFSEAGTATYVQIYPGGVVRGIRCDYDNSGMNVCDAGVELDKLNKTQLKKISKLIDRARHGQIIGSDPGEIRCMAMPFQQVNIQADGGSVFLKSYSFPCGDTTFNDTLAAAELSNMMEAYRNEYEQGVRY